MKYRIKSRFYKYVGKNSILPQRSCWGKKSTSQRFTKLQGAILENGERFCIEFRIITKTEGEVNTCKTGAQPAWGRGASALPF